MAADQRSESDYLPIFALQHLVFCERQCALIHVERLWVDNRLTVEGTQLHERVDETGSESRRDLRSARGMRLVSDRLALIGRADVVEFHRTGDSEMPRGTVSLRGSDGSWRILPVEYKRGQPKSDRSDDVQLCAQALCLEEMFGTHIESGALYYGKRRQRTDVALDPILRSVTEGYVRRLHELVTRRETPRVAKQPKCRRCSMFDVCLPHGTDPDRSASGYLTAALHNHLDASQLRKKRS